MENQSREYLGWMFWLIWVLANSVGWIIGMSLVWVLNFLLASFPTGGLHMVGWVVVGALVGAIFGVNQWFIFRPLGNNTIGKWAHWWFVATVIGWSIGITVIIGFGAGESLGFTVTGAVLGIAVGIPQWFVVRPYTQNAEWWAVGSTVGWIMGLALLDLLNEAVGFSLVGVVSGMVTGGVMVWLLQNPRETE